MTSAASSAQTVFATLSSPSDYLRLRGAQWHSLSDVRGFEPSRRNVVATDLILESSGNSSGEIKSMSRPREDRLRTARMRLAGTLELEFEDGVRKTLAVRKLGMPVDRIRWSTAAASPTGECMTVTAIKGETIPIDAATLRYLVDKSYAANIDASIRALQFSDEELERIGREGPPPTEWFEQDSSKMILESWK